MLIVGGSIIILGYTLEHLIDFIEHRLRKVKYSRLEWSANDVLQTQRMAHEELGIGTWDNCIGASAVPVTEEHQLLAVLDIQDPKHPRLKVFSASVTTGKIDSPPTQLESGEESEESSVDNAPQERLPTQGRYQDSSTCGGIQVRDKFHQLGTPPTQAESQEETRAGTGLGLEDMNNEEDRVETEMTTHSECLASGVGTMANVVGAGA